MFVFPGVGCTFTDVGNVICLVLMGIRGVIHVVQVSLRNLLLARDGWYLRSRYLLSACNVLF